VIYEVSGAKCNSTANNKPRELRLGEGVETVDVPGLVRSADKIEAPDIRSCVL
jgi:hypothetical protein